MAPGADVTETVSHQLQAFLDEWHFRMVQSQMVKNWDRQKALGMALDLLEYSGLKYPSATFKDEILNAKEDEDSIVGKLVDCMPKEMKTSFDEYAQELQKALSTAATLRRAVDDNNEQAIYDGFEANTESPLACEYILRKATIQAAVKATKVRRCHATWRQNSEARIDRLMRSAEDAEHANSQLLAVQTQIDMHGDSHKAKSKGMLVGMTAKNNKAVMHTCFANWLAIYMKAKADNSIRAKFQAQLAEAEKRLFTYKERQLANIKGVLGRKIAEEGDNLRLIVVGMWKKMVDDAKNEGDTQGAIKAAKARLDAMREGQTAAAKKVLVSMSSKSNEGLLTMIWQGWQQFIEDYKRNKELEDAVKAAENKFKEHMAAKKDEAKRVMERMQGASNQGLLAMVCQSWRQVVVEVKHENEMSNKLLELDDKLSGLKLRQGATAAGVQGRINEQMNMNLLLRIFSHWLLQSKTNHIEAHFTRKLESKRKQLQGVQHLFKTFAAQLDQGLGDGQDSSRGNTGRDSIQKSQSRKSRPHGDSKQGFVRGQEGSVSLPDIHGHARAYP